MVVEASEDSESETSSSEGLKRLEDELWFHGFLPKEDIERMFKDDGDFAVRYTLDEQRRLVLTVLVGRSLKSYPITETRSNTFFVEKQEFESVGDLVSYYTITKTPLVEGSGAVLARGVPQARWEHDHDAFQLQATLGEGEFGRVVRGLWRQRSGKVLGVAVKENKRKGDPAVKLELLTEARLMLGLSHNHVLRCLGVAVKKDPIYIVMELVEGGSLRDWLRKQKQPMAGLSKQLHGFALQVADALKYLEEKKIVHRDLATRNVLLEAGGHSIKLADFGLAMTGGGGRKKDAKRVPVKWTAPEGLAKEEFTAKSDVWSFGVVLWEMWSRGAEPWSGKNNEAVRKEVGSGRRPDLPPDLPATLAALLLSQLWAQDPAKRPAPSNLPALLKALAI